MDGELALGGTDGLVPYLTDRLTARGHTVTSSETPRAAIRVVDPTREDFAAHVAELSDTARHLARGGVTISIVTRHGSKAMSRYNRAVREARVAHGVAGVRSVGIVTGEVRDPATTGPSPIDPVTHARLFPGTLDPEAIVLAIEVMLELEGCIAAGTLETWLVAGPGTVREPIRAIAGANRRHVRETLVAAGIAIRVEEGSIARPLIGHDLATYFVRTFSPRDFADHISDDVYEHSRTDPSVLMAELWADAINKDLDKVAAKVTEPRRAWMLDTEHVAFTTAQEWALLRP